MSAYSGYLTYFLAYMCLTALLAWGTHRYYQIRWIDAAIAANGLMSGVVMLSLVIASSFGIRLPYRLGPAALVSMAVVFFNNFKGNIARFARRVPTPVGKPDTIEEAEASHILRDD